MLGDLIASVLKNPSDQKIPMPERDLFDQVGEFCRDLYGSRPINPTPKKKKKRKRR